MSRKRQNARNSWRLETRSLVRGFVTRPPLLPGPATRPETAGLRRASARSSTPPRSRHKFIDWNAAAEHGTPIIIIFRMTHIPIAWSTGLGAPKIFKITRYYLRDRRIAIALKPSARRTVLPRCSCKRNLCGKSWDAHGPHFTSPSGWSGSNVAITRRP